MSNEENTFEIDLGLKGKEINPPKADMIFVSNAAGPKGHLLDPFNLHGVLRILHFRCEANVDYPKKSKFILCKLPQGKIRVLGHMSCIDGIVPGFLVGWSNFRNRFRSIKPGSKDGIMSMEVKTKTGIFGRAPNQSVAFDSLEGVEVYATSLTDGKKGDYIEGFFIYVK